MSDEEQRSGEEAIQDIREKRESGDELNEDDREFLDAEGVKLDADEQGNRPVA